MKPSSTSSGKTRPGISRRGRIPSVEIVDFDRPRRGRSDSRGSTPATSSIARGHIKAGIRRFIITLVLMLVLIVVSIQALRMYWQHQEKLHLGTRHVEPLPSPAIVSDIPPPEVEVIPPAIIPDSPPEELSTEPINKAVFFSRQARNFENQGDIENAIRHYEDALALNPNLTQVFARLGRLYLMSRDYERAVYMLNRAIESNPGSAEIMNDLGAAHLQLGRADDALLSFKAALAVNPDFRNSYFNAALAYIQLKKPETAREYLERYREREPDDAKLYRELAYLDAMERNYDEALGHLDKSISLEPTWDIPYIDAATIAAALDRKDDALAYLEKGQEVIPPSLIYRLLQSPAFESIRITEEGTRYEARLAHLAKQRLREATGESSAADQPAAESTGAEGQ